MMHYHFNLPATVFPQTMTDSTAKKAGSMPLCRRFCETEGAGLGSGTGQ